MSLPCVFLIEDRLCLPPESFSNDLKLLTSFYSFIKVFSYDYEGEEYTFTKYSADGIICAEIIHFLCTQ